MSGEDGKKCASSKTSKSRSDTAVRGTNDSSIVSKCSMASMGYFSDEYLQYFVDKKKRRAPLINRGYYIRAKAIDYVLNKFISSHTKSQVISLGAGYDSAFFRLKSQEKLQNTIWVEVDFLDTMKNKLSLIRQSAELEGLICEELGNPAQTGISEAIVLSTPDLKLLGVDLTKLSLLDSSLKYCGIDLEVPTLLLSECVMTYMGPKRSSAVIQWAAATFHNAVFVTYEQVLPGDSFGRVMQNHFHKIGSPLKGINTYPTIQAQKKRYTDLCWSTSSALDMNQFYFNILSREERQLIETLEPFDEYEEWHLKCAHYMVLCAYKGMCEELLGTLNGGDNGDQIESLPTEMPQSPFTLQEVSKHSTLTPPKFEVTGHTLTRLDSGHLVVIGGFGVHNGHHTRLDSIQVWDKNTGQCWIVTDEQTRKELAKRMFHTTCVLKNGHVLVIGGRESPVKPCKNNVLFSIKQNPLTVNNQMDSDDLPSTTNIPHILSNGDKRDDLIAKKDRNCVKCNSQLSDANKDLHDKQPPSQEDHNLEYFTLCSECNTKYCYSIEPHMTHIASKAIDFETTTSNISPLLHNPAPQDGPSMNSSKTWTASVQDFPTRGSCPPPRWRHSAVVVESKGHEYVIVYGGRDVHNLVLGDCYRLCVTNMVWDKVDIATSSLHPEPRHSHSACVWDNHMVIACGLGDDLRPLNSVYLMDVDTLTWSKLQTHGKLLPRYSHTCHVKEDRLYLMGGVNLQGSVGLGVVDLKTGDCQEFMISIKRPETPIMLHNHCSEMLDEVTMVIVGGGGNCFSFGTHLNKTPVYLSWLNS